MAAVVSYGSIRKLLEVYPKLGGIAPPDDGRRTNDALDRLPLLTDPICTRAAKIVTEKAASAITRKFRTRENVGR